MRDIRERLAGRYRPNADKPLEGGGISITKGALFGSLIVRGWGDAVLPEMRREVH